MEDLRSMWVSELKDRNEILSLDRYTWMLGLFENDDHPVDIEKARTISGYLMALRDCGKNIGDLKLILEQIIQEIKNN